MLTRGVIIAPFDAALAGLVALWLIEMRRERAGNPVSIPASITTVVTGALAFVVVASFIVHPSPRGIEMILRAVAAIAVVDSWRLLPVDVKHKLLGLLLAMGAAQSVLAMIQSWRKEPFGLNLVDYAGPLYQFGDSYAGRGGLHHPYHLTVFVVVAMAAGLVGILRAQRVVLWLGGLALCGAGIAVTYSRASLLGLAPAAVLVLLASRRSGWRILRASFVVVAIGFVAAALVFGTGWTSRLEDTTGDNTASGRSERWREAADLASDNLLLGVGPGRYTIELSDRSDSTTFPLPAHNVLAHSAAELGVVGAGLVAILGVFALLFARRRGALALAAVLLVVPFFLLDAYPYVIPTGIATTALLACVVLSTPKVRNDPVA